MKLDAQGMKDRAPWEAAGYKLPQYDVEKMVEATKENPFWIHFGAGNIFRAFQASVVQDLLDEGVLDRGLVVAEGYDYDIVRKVNRPHDEYTVLVTLKADGNIEKEVIGSIAESCILDSEDEAEYSRLKEIFQKDSLQMASFTITEKGYSLVDGKGDLLPSVAADYKNGVKKPASYLGKVVSLLYARYQAGEKPMALVSMDNCSHNGEKLEKAVLTIAKTWAENGLVEEGFLAYVNDRSKVTFPWSMIDKITPRPDATVEEILKKDGVEGTECFVTPMNTFTSAFVNAEECEYLVIEDSFPNGRPALEKGGIMFTTREMVDRVEKMKVCTCLNPLHTALAIMGCTLGFTKISDEMQDEDLRRLVERIGYDEGLPVVVSQDVINVQEFIDAVVKERIPNPFMPDTPQRISRDSSQKLSIRFGETVKAYVESDTLDVNDLKMIPLVFAGWLRYLMQVDDEGNAFALNPDVMQDIVCPIMEKVTLGYQGDVEEAIKPILTNKRIFSNIDLYEIGMAEKVIKYFSEMITGPGAVRATLHKYVQQ